MIKARGHSTTTGRQFIILGLSHRNLDLLREGRPIHVHGEEVELDLDIVIFAGETESKLMEDMRREGLI